MMLPKYYFYLYINMMLPKYYFYLYINMMLPKYNQDAHFLIIMWLTALAFSVLYYFIMYGLNSVTGGENALDCTSQIKKKSQFVAF